MNTPTPPANAEATEAVAKPVPEMTDEELNVRLAEIRGWTDIEILRGRTPDEVTVIGMHPPIPNWRRDGSAYEFQSKSKIPDYCIDANAVAEVRRRLTREQKDAFARHVHELVWREFGQPDCDSTFALIDASPRLQTIALILCKTH